MPRNSHEIPIIVSAFISCERRAVWFCGLIFTLLLAGCDTLDDPDGIAPLSHESIRPDAQGVFHVYPGTEIQHALDAAAAHADSAIVRVHSGVYAPSQSGQAFLRFTEQHDGITLEADGEVVLGARHPGPDGEYETEDDFSVNHVIYFGDGISSRTVLRGFRISGARGGSMPRRGEKPLEPRSNERGLQPGIFFYLDGGAIKIFGRSSPTITETIIEDNETALCGGGVSVEHRGLHDQPARFISCIFRNNRCPATGSAVDLLEGSSASFENCLFVNNIGNYGMDRIQVEFGLSYNEKHGSGALTVFPNSRVEVTRSTFTGNWNGVDDHGTGSVYRKNIFWKNDASDGSREGEAYEVDIIDASGFSDCWIGGGRSDLRDSLNRSLNRLDAPNPKFDEAYRPQLEGLEEFGYRPSEERPLPP